MTRLIFSGAAGLYIPSPHVLRFLERQIDFVAYEVVGFGQDLLLLDYRESQQGQAGRPGTAVAALAADFARPSHLEIWEFGPAHMQIELYDTIQGQVPWQLSLTPSNGKVRPNHRAFYQRLPAASPDGGGAVITLERQRRSTAVSPAASSLNFQAAPQPAV